MAILLLERRRVQAPPLSPPPIVLPPPSAGIVWKGSPNFTAGRPLAPVVLMIHTMGGSLAGSDSWFGSPASVVSSHYGVGLGGAKHQYVALENQAWVNGILEYGNRWREVLDAADVPWDDLEVQDYARFGPNALTVGVETEDLGSGATQVNDALYRSTLEVCRVAIQRYPTIRVVSSHHIVSPKSRVNCAGFRWTSGQIQQLARDLDLALVI